MSKLLGAIQENRELVLEDWLRRLKAAVRRQDLVNDRESESQIAELLSAITDVAAGTSLENFTGAGWEPLKQLLAALSISRANLGFTPSETALFVLSLKPSLFTLARKNWGNDAAELFAEISVADDFVDKLALHTTDSYIHGRDQVIARQQEEMLELSTPVVTLWDGIVALPLIGTLDSARTQVVMESLLQAIVETNSRIARESPTWQRFSMESTYPGLASAWASLARGG